MGNLKYSKQEKSDRKRSKTNMITLKSTLVTSKDTLHFQGKSSG